MNLGLQLQDRNSSSTESINISHRESTAMGKTSSQDQSASSDSIHDDGKHGQIMNPGFYMYNPELSINASQAEASQPMIQFPFAYPDPCLSGLFTGYGPHTMIQPAVMGAVAGRVPLPADLPDDGPIFVNAKQYQGILRRRQTRAKLEAQNRVIKARKPYLHESRHQHALNRVRGTGGRFLSTKKAQSSDSQPSNFSQGSQGSFHFINQQGNMGNSNGHHRIESNQHSGPPSSSEGTSIPPHMATSMQGGSGGGRLMYNGNQHYASIVQ